MDFKSFMAPISKNIDSLIHKARLMFVDDSKNLQSVQINFGKQIGDINAIRIQNFGFTSVPNQGSEAVMLFLDGTASSPVVISVDDSRVREKNLEDGETAVYNSHGSKIILKKDSIEIISDKDLNINTNANIKGNLTVSGKITGEEIEGNSAQTTLTQIKDIYNNHTHGSSPKPGIQI